MPRKTWNRRRRIFVGVEGESERSFVTWLRLLCDSKGCNLHLDTMVCGGGDTYAMAHEALRSYQRRKIQHGDYESAFVLLDHDRLEQDRAADRDPRRILNRTPLKIIWQKPNHEGLLYRLHSGKECKFLPANKVKEKLQGKWPSYSKNSDAIVIEKQFTLDDLIRAARYDENLKELLKILRLPVQCD